MQANEYHKKIVAYYQQTENAYKDSWDMDNSLAIHYGYWDEKVKSFPESLQRMNEVMIETVNINAGDKVLDAGCGVGGSSIFLAKKTGCQVIGITLSARQAQLAISNAMKNELNDKVDFKIMDYSDTVFDSESFDVIWGCESICYAEDKKKFIEEAYRLLKKGGRLILADGFVTRFENNNHPIIRKWLDGWQVNYLESAERFQEFMNKTGFVGIRYKDISKYTFHSSKRLYRFYFLASLYLLWKKITFSNKATNMQKQNIKACKFQYLGMKRALWTYGLIVGIKS